MKIKKPDFVSLILFEDENYIVVNKPPFISSLDDRQEPLNLLKLARAYNAHVQLCHRLDKETSGTLILAKNPESYRSMAIHFEKRRVKKIYHAVVDGIHDLQDVRVEAPISVVQGKEARIDYKTGKKSLTIFRSLRAFGRQTLIECQPVTGRMHQIRAHLHFLKAPITGDTAYGGEPFYLSSIKRNYRLGKFKEERPLMKRLALHAWSLTFPVSADAETTVEAPYPTDFEILLKQLEKNS
jgi:23S rRNA pseudouridine955/2504/2580 synthase